MNQPNSMPELNLQLLVNLSEILHPKKLVSSKGIEIVENLNEYFNDGIFFRFAIPVKVIKSRKLFQILVLKLVEASDRIYYFITRMSTIWNRRPQALKIRILYNKVLDVLENSIDFYRNYHNGESYIPLTRNCLSQLKPNLYQKLSQVRSTLTKSEVNSYLRTVICNGLKNKLIKKKLTILDIEYLKRLMNGIIKMESITSYKVENFLYENEFNHPEFLKYIISVFNYNLAPISNFFEKIEFILKFEERVSNLKPQLFNEKFGDKFSVKEYLKTFLNDRKSYFQQFIELRVSEIEIQKDKIQPVNNELKLSVAQLGLFIRLFMEIGVVDNKEVGKTFSFYARNFRTPKVALISAESLQKKSSSFEYSTIKSVKGHLIGMLNWLNNYENTEFGK